MNFKTTSIVIKREYLNRVKKKSFLITTFVVPILMAALCVVPILLMMNSKDKKKTIGVIDRSGIAMEYLVDTETIDYRDFGTYDLDDLKSKMSELELDAVLSVSEINEADKSFTADLTSLKPFGMEVSENINNRLNDALENYRIESYGIEGLAQILEDVKPNVRLKSYTMDDKGKETISESGVYSALSMILGLVIFMFITLFGGMVMSAVIEEKTSRVVEVLVSSVKATELMFGKIIGIALVALTQFLLWIVLTAALVGGATAFMGKDVKNMLSDPSSIAQTVGVSAEQMDSVTAVAEQSEASVILGTITNLPIGKIIIVFLLFFILGYLLYASFYAAIGSAVENEGDTQQLQLPATIPLMIAYFIAIYTFNAPDSQIAFWGSIFPLTSPIVMLARIPFGVANWEIILSLALLFVTFVGCAYLSAKIYKVGILMFGKKSSWKDLWKWLKQN